MQRGQEERADSMTATPKFPFTASAIRRLPAVEAAIVRGIYGVATPRRKAKELAAIFGRSEEWVEAKLTAALAALAQKRRKENHEQG